MDDMCSRLRFQHSCEVENETRMKLESGRALEECVVLENFSLYLGAYGICRLFALLLMWLVSCLQRIRSFFVTRILRSRQNSRFLNVFVFRFRVHRLGETNPKRQGKRQQPTKSSFRKAKAMETANEQKKTGRTNQITWAVSNLHSKGQTEKTLRSYSRNSTPVVTLPSLRIYGVEVWRGILWT
jgi:hypothetical protein